MLPSGRDGEKGGSWHDADEERGGPGFQFASERAARSADRPVAAQNLLLSKLAETGTRRTSAKRRRRSRVA